MTLTELLVVIAIIAVLAALLFPSLQGAGEEGKRVHCVSNLRQCGAALFSYAGDHNGAFPPGGSDGPGDPLDTYSTALINALQSYLDFRDWGCPEVNSPPINNPANIGPTQRCSYQYLPYHTLLNGQVISGRVIDFGPRTLLMQDIVYFYSPANAWRSNHSCGGTLTTNTYPGDPAFATYFGGTPSGMNALFGDGHVGWIEWPNDTSQFAWLYWGQAQTPNSMGTTQ